jgi:hypothetical protein
VSGRKEKDRKAWEVWISLDWRLSRRGGCPGRKEGEG